ncbi:glucan 1,3-beta-glucosidase [Capronia coronata CBS 617.96]|uniref:Glucan 1,3-beta-glucosidase n=1 Tax=Capronia coronata CBS 617.96 TaxID=1182541 RepID=W9YM78_9EURO|nr:glucan 1,3-beta-glucosidase [Capronia coronata CBS 617.96]EXJ83349.1 glucan 1,3-beta-glucosidase [Capronia coronata CBS 617.96]
MNLPRNSVTMLFLYFILLPWIAGAVPSLQALAQPRQATSSYWFAQIQRQGTVAFGSDPNYKIFRSVKDYGAVGDGATDDTVAINNAISDGERCGQGCDSSTTTPAIIYFPPGKYAVSAPIVQYYYTQFVGDAINIPTIMALPNFEGLAILDTDPYIPGSNGAQWYTNQNNFFRQIRNFVIDLTHMPEDRGAGIHWQVAQATSLQNIVFNMCAKSPSNKQQGVFMDNGSGGFMSDLIFNGGNYGAFLGNQQFTSRNLTFNGCNTAVFMNWNWLWTFKSLSINDCDVGLDMSNLADATNQTVGSVVVLDSVMRNTGIGIKTSYNQTSEPTTGGTLALQNVDFTTTEVAIVGANGVDQILAGSSIVESWGQGDAYRPGSNVKRVKRAPQAYLTSTSDSCATTTTTTTVTISPVPATVNVSVSTTTVTVSALPSSSVNTGPQVGNYTWAPSSSKVCTATPLPLQSARVQQQLTAPKLPSSLMDGNAVFERSKPQYENVPVSSFVSVRSAGAKGDGVTDDTAAIQRIFDAASPDQIVYFDHGAYIVTNTVKVPSNIRITGEIWPLIMAKGDAFTDLSSPKPVFQIGTPGDTGSVEITDLIFETMGALPGAIMMEWNVAEISQGSCGMWDVHFRIGGTAGTLLQQDTCQANVTGSFQFKPECAGSFLMMHITQQASAYLENCWFWVADHELDLSGHNQTDIFNGRGLLVESQGPVWLWGTSSEHSQLYNYQFSNAKDIFMGAIQTETAYMQAAPDALNGGFRPNSTFSDPDFADCTTESCKKTWGLRIVESDNVYMYGAGLYSFFDNYIQTCLDTESCQENMVDIQCSTNVSLFGLTTKASVNMVNVDGTPEAIGQDHLNGFGQTLLLFQT